jgi:hypothetical protein
VPQVSLDPAFLAQYGGQTYGQGAPASAKQALPPPEPTDDPHNTTIFAGGLEPHLTADHLRALFAPYGPLASVKVPAGKCCGFIQFVHRASAEAAIAALHGYDTGSSRMRLAWGRTASKPAANGANGAAAPAQGQGQPQQLPPQPAQAQGQPMMAAPYGYPMAAPAPYPAYGYAPQAAQPFMYDANGNPAPAYFGYPPTAVAAPTAPVAGPVTAAAPMFAVRSPLSLFCSHCCVHHPSSHLMHTLLLDSHCRLAARRPWP